MKSEIVLDNNSEIRYNNITLNIIKQKASIVKRKRQKWQKQKEKGGDRAYKCVMFVENTYVPTVVPTVIRFRHENAE